MKEKKTGLSAELSEVLTSEVDHVLHEPRPENKTKRTGLKDSVQPETIRAYRTTAICLSGGGNRASTFSLGVLQALAHLKRLDRFSYISAVSGGNYCASWLTRLRAEAIDQNRPWSQDQLKEEPDNFSSDIDNLHPVRRLRSFSNYLSPRVGFSRDSLTFANSALRKFGFNLLSWMLLFVAVAAICRAIIAITGWGMHSVPYDFGNGRFSFLNDPVNFTAVAIPALIFFSVGLVSGASLLFARHDPIKQEKISTYCARVMAVAFGWLVFFGIFAVLPEHLWDALTVRELTGAKTITIAVSASGIVATLTGFWSQIPQQIQARAQGIFNRLKVYSLEIVSILALTSFATAAGYFVRWCYTKLPELSSSFSASFAEQAFNSVGNLGRSEADLVAPFKALEKAQIELSAAETRLEKLSVAGSDKVSKAVGLFDEAKDSLVQKSDAFDKLAAGVNTAEIASYAASWPALLAFAIIMLILALGFSEMVGANRSSLHSLYSTRLIRAFLGNARSVRKPHRPTDYDPDDDIYLRNIPTHDSKTGNALPLFPVINMTLNLRRGRGERGDWQQRKGASFFATPLRVGSEALGPNGFIDLHDIKHSEDKRNMTLGRAMTISGAAASPNMGYYSRPIVSIAMAVLNIRLGWWFPNPKVWNDIDEPLKSAEPLGGLVYILREAFGWLSAKASWLYLSDGGHFDNLGLYEMVRRHCHQILVIDAGCDGKFEYDDLLSAVRIIQVDFGVPIDLPASLPGQEGEGKNKRFVVAKIRYSATDPDAEDGTLVLLKPMLLGNEPPSLPHYRKNSISKSHSFPHHSTSDQFFDETQFESYRLMGAFSIFEMVNQLPQDNFLSSSKSAASFTTQEKQTANAEGEMPTNPLVPNVPAPALTGQLPDPSAPNWIKVAGDLASNVLGMSSSELILKTAGAVALATVTVGVTAEGIDGVLDGLKDVTESAVESVSPEADPGPESESESEAGSGSENSDEGALQASISSLTTRISELSTEIENHSKLLANDTRSADRATFLTRLATLNQTLRDLDSSIQKLRPPTSTSTSTSMPKNPKSDDRANEQLNGLQSQIDYLRRQIRGMQS